MPPSARPRRRPSRRWLLALAGYAVAMLVLVWGPLAWWLNRLTVRAYAIWVYDLQLSGVFPLMPEHVGALLNVLLFVPLGAFLIWGWRARSWWAPFVVALGCAVISAAIEAVQMLPGLDRDPAVIDVLTNAAGGLIGALTAVAYLRATERSRARTAERAATSEDAATR